MFAPALRHIAPSLLGWNRFIAANNAFNKFIEETITSHVKTVKDNNDNNNR